MALCAVLRYWLKLPVTLIVLDQSQTSNQFVPKSPRLTYIHSPESYLTNHQLAATMVSTPYVLIACDDELYIPSAVRECIEFLEQSPNHIAIGGEAIGFHMKGSVREWKEQYPKLRGYLLESENWSERVSSHLGSYRHILYYSVTRTEEWSFVWSRIARKSFSPFAVFELQLEAALAVAGKFRVLPQVMWIRNRAIAPLWGIESKESGFNPEHSFKSWWYSRRHLWEKQVFVWHTTRLWYGLLRQKKGFSLLSIRRVVISSFTAFAGRKPMKRNSPFVKASMAAARGFSSTLKKSRSLLRISTSARKAIVPSNSHFPEASVRRVENNGSHGFKHHLGPIRNGVPGGTFVDVSALEEIGIILSELSSANIGPRTDRPAPL